ncbi:MAG TPA: hypothetical protein PKY64_07270 [Anaerolineaceae bacterium]|nr:hypothetical protein [Anaerolineaceae bacterium]
MKTSLALGFLSNASSLSWFELQGAAMLPGMLGCEWEMRTGPGERVLETATVSIRGSLQELQAVTEGFESLRLGAKRKGDLCLRIWSETRDCFLYSLLHQFDWQILPAHLLSKEGGSFSLKLNWERDNIFYGDEVSLPLSNTSGSGITNGLTIYNHDDASVGHDNWFEVNLLSIGNLLELPMRLELKNSTSGEPLADFWLGSICLPGSGNLPNLVFEAENGVGGSVLADASASSGNYSRYDWSGSGWHSLASWTISSLDVTRMNGIGLLPLLRFFGTPGEANLKLRWQLLVDGVPVWVGPATDLEFGQSSLRMEPLLIPWSDLPLRSLALGQQLMLEAFHIGTGAHRVQLDDFLLLPQQTFGAYHAISSLKQDVSLIDDPLRQAVWSESGGLELTTHLRVGSGHRLQPGTLQRFYCFQTEATGVAPIARTLSVRAWYRPAWRLP